MSSDEICVIDLRCGGPDGTVNHDINLYNQVLTFILIMS